jgi:hypothetical protein
MSLTFFIEKLSFFIAEIPRFFLICRAKFAVVTLVWVRRVNQNVMTKYHVLCCGSMGVFVGLIYLDWNLLFC